MSSQLKYVLGHKNPDTDCTCASIGLAYFLDFLPLAAGEFNPETIFVLKKFCIDPPQILHELPSSSVYLVDHSDSQQIILGIEHSTILGVIDHHKIGDIGTLSRDIFTYICKPIGSTSSIISELYFMHRLDYIGAKNKELPPSIAGALLSGILSDTLLFRSPTTTDLDRSLAHDLTVIAGIKDIHTYGMEMLKAKSSVVCMSPEKMLEIDRKVFSLHAHKVSISQIELVNDALLESQKKALKDLLHNMIEGEIELAMLVITNIITEDSEVLVFGNIQIFERAFDVKVKDNSAILKKIVSRKKQILPKLEFVFSQ